jgi:tetratricopeptide (TPR) repeat protein
LRDEEKAMADVEEALKLRPGYLPALRARAALAAGEGKFNVAISDLNEIKNSNPDDPSVLLQLGMLYSASKQLHEAVETFSKLIQVDSKNVLAYQGRADTYIRMGKHAEAIKDYDVVLQHEPKNSHVLNNLAWLLATSPDEKLRNGKRAIELATEGCKVTEYKQPHILSTLAAGYAEIGDFDTAIAWSKKAVELGDGELKENLEKELESYQAKKPWRELQDETLEEKSEKPAEKTATRPGERK